MSATSQRGANLQSPSPRQKRRTIRKTSSSDLHPKTFACQTHPALSGQTIQSSDDRSARPRWFAGSLRQSRMRHLFTMSNTRKLCRARSRIPQKPRPRSSDRCWSQTGSPGPPSTDRWWSQTGSPGPPITDRWWSQTGSNRRPHACKARALPTELWPRARRSLVTSHCGGPGTTRTSDLTLIRGAL
jgi:hypothetical protein